MLVHSSGTPLFSTKFLDITETVGILKEPTFVQTLIPDGLKNNVYFILGLFPGHNSHGFSKNTDSIYLRTPSYVMDKIEELSKHNLPRTVYNAISSTKDETPINNMKQIRNKKYY